ncbi:MAG: hypothetical protein IAI50_09125, partial [Candidatus Eremiobacteraeota bacterium]|nr:hypothetical protein [Candidatus Eremiobacteraeota bacterium]
GGHLFLAVTDADSEHVRIVEAGPLHPGGSGALVPFRYPEDDFAKRGVVDFEPMLVAPPHGLEAAFFADLVRTTQRRYDGDQRYLAIEIPFFRVGRDSNSYAVGVLLCCGVDVRAIPKKPAKMTHYEWTGYPGAEDPVHRANFGAYMGAPTHSSDGILEVAYHDEDGSVRLVVVGGAPNGRARLPDGADLPLDELGRIVLSPEDARRHGLPTRHTEPPVHIRNRRRFPADPAPAGAEITLVIDSRAVPLRPGDEHRGKVIDRHDALGMATLRAATSDVVLPLAELGVELRDPKRVDMLFQVGNDVTVGLHRDRHPKLVSHGAAWLDDNLRWHKFHAPRPVNVATTVIACGIALLAGVALWRLRRS